MLSSLSQRSLEVPTTKFISGELDQHEFIRQIRQIVEDYQKMITTNDFSILMGNFIQYGLELLNAQMTMRENDSIPYRIAGLLIFDCLLDANDEVSNRRLEISTHLMKVVEEKLSLDIQSEVLRLASTLFGHFARVATQSETEQLTVILHHTISMMNIRRYESNRFVASLIISQLVMNAGTSVFNMRKMIMMPLLEMVCDRNTKIRIVGTLALESFLQMISQREEISYWINFAFSKLMEGFHEKNQMSERLIGSLNILSILLNSEIVSTVVLVGLLRQRSVQASDLIWKVFQLRHISRDIEVRNKVIEMIPIMASSFGSAFLQTNSHCSGGNFLSYSMKLFKEIIERSKNSRTERPLAYISLGRLFQVLSSHFRSVTNVSDIFTLIQSGFNEPFCLQALNCLGVLVNISPVMRKFVDEQVIDDMFRGGLSPELLENLKIILKHVSNVRPRAQALLRKQISTVLSNHSGYVEEIRTRPVSGRRTTTSTTHHGVRDSSRSSMWSSFGSKPDEPVSQTIGLRGEDELMFALKTLCMSEFFPKQTRERMMTCEDVQTRELLSIVRNSVVRYMDVFNPEVRKLATQACASILDIIIASLDPNSKDMHVLYQILDRLLTMGVGDDSRAIRILVFQSITPSMDLALSLTDNVHCLIEALNDESLDVRAAAMTVLARVAHYDTLHVMPVVRLTLKRLIFTLNNAQSHLVKQESVQLLQALVRGSNSLIVPYVGQVIGPLLTLLSDDDAPVVIAALSTIGELALASPASVREHLDELSPRLIEALNDHSSLIKQETAVVAMGKLVSSLTFVTDEPYKKYVGLFGGLVKAVQSVDDSSSELRLQAIKTLGLLGSVDIHVYQRYLAGSASVLGNFGSSGDESGELAETMAHVVDERVTKTESNYLTVVLRELMNVLKDSNPSLRTLASNTASNTTMRIVRSYGLQTLPLLSEILDAIIYRLYLHDTLQVKDGLLEYLNTLIQVMKSHLAPYTQKLIKVVVDFYESHLPSCLMIYESLAHAFSTPDFSVVLQTLLPLFCRIIDNECRGDNLSKSGQLFVPNTSEERTKVSSILVKFIFTKDALGEHRRDLIPFVIGLVDHPNLSRDIKRHALSCAVQLAAVTNLQEFAGRIVHPVLRMLRSKDTEIFQPAVLTLSYLVCKLGPGYIPYIVPVHRKIKSAIQPDSPVSRLVYLEEYESLVSRLLKQKPLPLEPNDIHLLLQVEPSPEPKALLLLPTSNPVDLDHLTSVWAIAENTSAFNLGGWIQRIGLELIRQSPSPIIAVCHPLAKSCPPFFDSLFNSAFHCMWEQLYSHLAHEVIVDNSLVRGVELVLNAPEISDELLASLLNLAEFMDLSDKALPIDTRMLARRAQEANMYAKCLRYREIEFRSVNLTPTIECIDALIVVNNQLGMSDSAIGILRHLMHAFPDIVIQPQWLEKLCRWDDAQHAYELNASSFISSSTGEAVMSAAWMKNEVGLLRCLHALGEYNELQVRAKQLKDTVKNAPVDMHEVYGTHEIEEVQRLGANATWMIGNWELMEEFVDGDSKARDVVLDQNLSFYQAVLAIRNQDYDRATVLINDTRASLSGPIASLLSESYSRAYRAMVTMQVLAELEEVIDYKLLAQKLSLDADSSPTNNTIGQEGLLGSHGDRSSHNGGVTSGNGADKINPVAADLASKKADLIRKWRARLKWAPKDVSIYRQILAVHTLVAEPKEDLDSWLELVTLCRKEGMSSLCANILRRLGAPLPAKSSSNSAPLSTTSDNVVAISGTTTLASALSTVSPPLSGPAVGGGATGSTVVTSSTPTVTGSIIEYNKCNEKVLFSTFQYWWSNGDKVRALSELTNFLKSGALDTSLIAHSKEAMAFKVRCLLKRASWMRELDDDNVTEILHTIEQARGMAREDYSVWHAWAVANYDQLKKTDLRDKVSAEESLPPAVPIMSPLVKTNRKDGASSASKHITQRFGLGTHRGVGGVAGTASLLTLSHADKVTQYVQEAIKGFVRSIILGNGQPVANLLQDTLRLITLWFSYGTKKAVHTILDQELENVSAENWLSVIPQLIARIHIKSVEISSLLRKILRKVAGVHPQALVCPIHVAHTTADPRQREAATEVLMEMRQRNRQLVDEANMVSRELMKVAITPHELWYDGLEQAAQCYMDNKDLTGMLNTLRELHDTLNETGTTETKRSEVFPEGLGKIGSSSLRDVSFRHNYSRSLQDAQFWIEQFKTSGKTVDLHQAWEIYQAVFKRIKLQIVSLKKLELHHVSPALTAARNLILAVPGTYRPFAEDIGMGSFSPTIHVINSKQRPRRMSIFGSNGKAYQFLLKGHEDLRQDERVMQLFGLINVCLNNDRITGDRGLDIVRYSVLPLSNNSGVIGWVENCDTINQLVKQYRELKDIRLMIEAKLLQSKAPSYDKLPLMQKVEIFMQVHEETTGEDLAKMLWLKSKSSDVWIERRSHYTKSLAVMSMVGYILGLGDRHPSNLMLHRSSGQVVHIDFGDCFEITAQRSKFPEIVPFRLTRMLIAAMECAGLHGTYRLTCERVMRVMRDNRDSVMAMLEAFVYDPLISWRLLAKNKANTELTSMPRSNSIDGGDSSAVELMREQVGTLGDGDDVNTSSPSLRPTNAAGSVVEPHLLRRTISQDLTDEDAPLQQNLNSRALEVINRIQAKLTGRDFLKVDDDESDDFTVEQQVDRLITEATKVENLCQLFQGWCPLW